MIVIAANNIACQKSLKFFVAIRGRKFRRRGNKLWTCAVSSALVNRGNPSREAKHWQAPSTVPVHGVVQQPEESGRSVLFS